VPKSILLDIEGTTTPIAFVYNTLFPYARQHLASFLSTNPNEDLTKLSGEYESDHAADKPPYEPVPYLTWLMDKDRKSTALKSIQGKIWKQGFESGQLKGEFFEDVPQALERWVKEAKRVFIFSSGSVLAQQLIFKYSNYGDLTKFLSGFFDTETGPKREPASYKKIAQAIGEQPNEILFLSDVPEELSAAQTAGMQIALVVRPGNKPVESYTLDIIRDFSDI